MIEFTVSRMRAMAGLILRKGMNRFDTMLELMDCGFTEVEARILSGLPVDAACVRLGIVLSPVREFTVPFELGCRLEPYHVHIDLHLARN